MSCRSKDGGRTWSQPETVVDTRWDERSVGLLRCRDGTVLCCVNVQASWSGFDEAPAEYADQLDGLNSKQYVIRSTDAGRSWSQPIWLDSPGKFYERGQSPPIQLPDGGILWATYCADSSAGPLFGSIRRSDDSGRTWKGVSTIRRGEGKDVDEPAIARLADGRLILVCRPDGALYYSSDDGATWLESRSMIPEGWKKQGPDLVLAPRWLVLKGGALACVASYYSPQHARHGLHLFLSRDSGVSWTRPIPVDPNAYGYPALLDLKPGSLLIAYVTSAMPPVRLYGVRLQVGDGEKVDFVPLR